MEFSFFQTAWAQQLNPVVASPFVNGNFLKQITLTAGTPNVINHLLGRNLQGWFLTRQRPSTDSLHFASIYDGQDKNTTPNLTLILNTSFTVSVDIFVF